MKSLLEKRNTIYGACAIWIILFHSFRRISMPYIPVITNVISIGNMAVDIFFFFSGLCLSLSAARHDYPATGWGGYFKARLKRVLLPYLLICVPYYLWAALFETSSGIGRRVIMFFANLSSASFWLKGTQTTWYVYGILVFYFLFPLIYTFVKKSGAGRSAVLVSGMIVVSIASAYLPVIKNSMVVWARLPIFTLGVIAGTILDKGQAPGAAQLAAAALAAVVLGWLTSTSELSESFTIPQVYKLLLFIPLSLALLSLFARFGKRNRFLDWVGGLSLEIYLIHITLLHPLKYYGILSALGSWLYLFLPLLTLPLAWIVGMIEKQILKQEAHA